MKWYRIFAGELSGRGTEKFGNFSWSNSLKGPDWDTGKKMSENG